MVEGVRRGSLRLPNPASIAYRLIEGWFDAGHLGALDEALATLEEGA
jgi:hypothetical protein